METKVKSVLKGLVKAGMAKGGVYKGAAFTKMQLHSIEDGVLKLQKEYFQSFTPITFVEPSVVLITAEKERMYLYEI